MKMHRQFGAVLAGLALSACVGTSTPQGVVAAAGVALEKNDYTAFRSHLDGAALASHGNFASFQRLQRRFAPRRVDLALQSVLVNEVRLSARDTEGLYRVDIRSRRNGARLGTAYVRCERSAAWRPVERASCGPRRDDPTCSMPSSGYTVTSDCAIVEID